MRILHFLGTARIPNDPDREPASGVVRVALELAREQAAAGHAVTLATAGATPRMGWWRGVRLETLGTWRWARAQLAGRRLDFSTHGPLVLLALFRRYDVVHAHNYGYLRFLNAGMRVMHFHSDPLYQNAQVHIQAWGDADFRVVRKRASRIIAVSRFIADQANQGLGEGRIYVVPNGVDFARFSQDYSDLSVQLRHQWSIPQAAVVYLYCGVIDRVKGVRQLAEAFARTVQRGVPAHLLIAGSAGLWARRGEGGAFETELSGLLDPLARQGLVTFLGSVGQDDMPAVYHVADVVVVPSIWTEAFALVVLEAQASGRPVVASRIGGLPELVDDTNGLLVEPGNVDALAQALEELGRNPRRREELGVAARKAAQTRTWSAYAAAIDEVYGATQSSPPTIVLGRESRAGGPGRAQKKSS